MIRTGGLRHDQLPVGPNPEGRNRRSTRKPFRSKTKRHVTKTIGSWQLGFSPWFGCDGPSRCDGDFSAGLRDLYLVH